MFKNVLKNCDLGDFIRNGQLDFFKLSLFILAHILYFQNVTTMTIFLSFYFSLEIFIKLLPTGS